MLTSTDASSCYALQTLALVTLELKLLTSKGTINNYNCRVSFVPGKPNESFISGSPESPFRGLRCQQSARFGAWQLVALAFLRLDFFVAGV